MLKGVLEGCVLIIIGQREAYGYEISRQLQEYGFGRITEGTVYPLLLRLEKNALITAVYRQSEMGPPRKYYRLTAAGQQEIQTFSKSYREMSHAVSRLLQRSEGERHE